MSTPRIITNLGLESDIWLNEQWLFSLHGSPRRILPRSSLMTTRRKSLGGGTKVLYSTVQSAKSMALDVGLVELFKIKEGLAK
jgi:hypothetical protein